MRKPLLYTAAAVVTLGVVGACTAGTDSSVPARPAATASSEAPASPSPVGEEGDSRPMPSLSAAPTTAAAEVAEGNLPDLVDMNHQAAQNAAQAAGFFRLMEKDASGAGRILVWDSNWKVCGQSPAPGTHGVDTTVTLASVKETEACP